MHGSTAARGAWTGRLLRLATAASLVAGLAALLFGVPHSGTPGWDASGHGFAALRMAQALRELDLERFLAVFHEPVFYPPLGRLGYVLAFLVDGNGYGAPRAINCVAWIASIALATLVARRLVERASADTAAFFTAVLGLSCWVGSAYARCAYLEPWSALVNGAGILLYLRARERGRTRDALLVGAALGIALLVRYTYGLQLLAAVGATGLVELLRPQRRAATLRASLALAAALAAILAWWFVLPLPYGPDMGAAHRAAFREYLTISANTSTYGPQFVLVAWGLMSFPSLAAVLLQLAAFAWGVSRSKDEAHRLCLFLGLIGPIAFVLYPYRIDRFLIPALPAGWALAGAFAALLIARCAPRVRPAVGVALLALLLGTAGLGAERVLRLAFPSLPEELPSQAVANLAEWRAPYAFRRAPGAGPEGTEDVLAFAVEHLDPKLPFGWIGGTTTELPLALVQWTLFRDTGESAALWREPDLEDAPWEDPGWDEARFREWALRFAQVVALDPPDPRDRAGRDFERTFVAWMRRHPDFEIADRTSVTLDGSKVHEVTVYRRPLGAAR